MFLKLQLPLPLGIYDMGVGQPPFRVHENMSYRLIVAFP